MIEKLKKAAKNENIDIMAIQESHSREKDWSRQIGFNSGVWSHGDRASRGVGLLFSEKVEILSR